MLIDILLFLWLLVMMAGPVLAIVTAIFVFKNKSRKP